MPADGSVQAPGIEPVHVPGGGARCVRGSTGSHRAGTGAFRVAGTGWLVRPVCGRVYDRRQQVRNASSQGQVRLIFSMGGAADQLGGQHP